MRRLFLLACAVFVASILLVPGSLSAQGAPLCFNAPGITNCIEGRFREYWEQNGGLAVFGYPITAATMQQTAEGSFLTQYFERNRFELHPEKPRPYDVLLGRLGDDRLKQQGRNWFVFPKGQQTAGCLWFAETGHSVCDQEAGTGFKSYWESHGLQDPALNGYTRSLALFGLPLSEAAVETNAAGATVLTQWFERARLEYHPNNPREFRVLLGLLGNETRTGTPVASPPTSPVPPPAPAPAPAPDPCAGTPPPVSASIRPSNCVRAGTIIYFDIFGFAPNEDVGFWLTTPDGETFGTVETYNIGPAGRVDDFPFDTSIVADFPGLWYWVFQGTTSGHKSIVYFRVLPSSSVYHHNR